MIADRKGASNSTGTLNSWTCKWRGDGLIVLAPPPGFEKICDHSSAAYDLVILMVILEFFGLAVAGYSFLVLRKLSKAQKGRALSKVELV